MKENLETLKDNANEVKSDTTVTEELVSKYKVSEQTTDKPDITKATEDIKKVMTTEGTIAPAAQKVEAYTSPAGPKEKKGFFSKIFGKKELTPEKAAEIEAKKYENAKKKPLTKENFTEEAMKATSKSKVDLELFGTSSSSSFGYEDFAYKVGPEAVAILKEIQGIKISKTDKESANRDSKRIAEMKKQIFALGRKKVGLE